MSNKAETKTTAKKNAATIQQLMEDKKAVHQEIRKGGNLSSLKAKGIRFVKPL